MKDLQEYLPHSTDKIKIARIWRLKSIYTFSNGNTMEFNNEECFASKELINDTINFYKEKCNNFPEGIKSVDYEAIEDIIQFNI